MGLAVIEQASEVSTGNANSSQGDGAIRLSIQDLLRLFSGAGASQGSARAGVTQRALDDDGEGEHADEGDDDDDDEDENEDDGFGSTRAPNYHWPEVTEPQEKGVELLQGGEFGRLGSKVVRRNTAAHISRALRNRSLKARLMHKEEIASVRADGLPVNDTITFRMTAPCSKLQWRRSSRI
jgi:hypothetical protein